MNAIDVDPAEWVRTLLVREALRADQGDPPASLRSVETVVGKNNALDVTTASGLTFRVLTQAAVFAP